MLASSALEGFIVELLAINALTTSPSASNDVPTLHHLYASSASRHVTMFNGKQTCRACLGFSAAAYKVLHDSMELDTLVV